MMCLCFDCFDHLHFFLISCMHQFMHARLAKHGIRHILDYRIYLLNFLYFEPS